MQPDTTDADAAVIAKVVAEHHAVELLDTLRALVTLVQIADDLRTAEVRRSSSYRAAKRLLRAIDAGEVPEPAPVTLHTRLAPAHDH